MIDHDSKAAQYVQALQAAPTDLVGPDRARVWLQQFLSPEALPWAAARACASLPPGNPHRAACLTAIMELRAIPKRSRLVAWKGEYVKRIWEGMLHSVEAVLTNSGRERCLEAAASAYAAAFPELSDGDGGWGRAVADEVDALVRGTATARIGAKTVLLLTGACAWHVHLSAEAGTGCPPRLLPNVTTLGLCALDEQVRRSWAAAWSFVREHNFFDCEPRALRLGWGKERGTVEAISGDSGGAATAAVLRAALEGTPLDDTCAVSLTLRCEGGTWLVGPVDDARQKMTAARQAGCERVVFHPDTPNQRQESREHQAEPVLATSFSEVWDHLTELVPSLVGAVWTPASLDVTRNLTTCMRASSRPGRPVPRQSGLPGCEASAKRRWRRSTGNTTGTTTMATSIG